jgi:hypothetical protein
MNASRRGFLQLACLAMGLALGLLAVPLLTPPRLENFEDLALGQGTTAVYATVDGKPIHCKHMVDAQGCLDTHRRSGGLPVILWLGNSQVHGINQYKEGEETAPAILFPRLRERGLHLVTFTQPNANLQEQLALYAYLESRLPIRSLILPVVFDDLRETGVRSDVLPVFEDPAARTVLEDSEVGRKLMARHVSQGEGDLAALHETVQERSETALNDWLGAHSQLWSLRPQLRGQLFKQLYNLRNSLLGITAQSTRRMIPGRMELNFAAMSEILRRAEAAGIEALAYVVPLRDDVAVPYDLAEYAAFKQRVERLAEEGGARFANLERLVPAELWGTKGSTNLDGELEIDFMHFQSGGHRLLADRLETLLPQSRAGAGT